MAAIGFQGVAAALAKLVKHKLLIRGSITDTKRRVVRHVLKDLVTNSPQWSGNLAQQWYVEFHGQKGHYQQIASYGEARTRDEAYSMGDDPAVSQTLAREYAKIDKIRWNSKIEIVNYAPYASDVEAGVGPDGLAIRPENQLASYGGVAMVGYVTMKYNNLRYLKGLAI